MAQEASIEDYLSGGGVLTSPANVSPRYRGELMRHMATFVDSELAGAAGFADLINSAPGLIERVTAARMVAEKLEHAKWVLEIMGTFGADVKRYVSHYPWTRRLDRDADIGAARHGDDMRLNVFHYPLAGWTDAVVMNVLMGRAVTIQLGELARVSYQPLAEVLRKILPREAHHADLAVAGLARILEVPAEKPNVAAAVAYWKPRVALAFGSASPDRHEALSRLGLRHRRNEELLAEWQTAIASTLNTLNAE